MRGKWEESLYIAIDILPPTSSAYLWGLRGLGTMAWQWSSSKTWALRMSNIQNSTKVFSLTICNKRSNITLSREMQAPVVVMNEEAWREGRRRRSFRAILSWAISLSEILKSAFLGPPTFLCNYIRRDVKLDLKWQQHTFTGPAPWIYMKIN